MSPQRIQLSRTRGWRLPEGAVSVARPTRWGNPWRIVAPDRDSAAWRVFHDGYVVSAHSTKTAAAADAVESYRFAISMGWGDVPWPDEIRAGLAGKTLACWCKPGEPCHADVLLAIAAGGDGTCLLRSN